MLTPAQLKKLPVDPVGFAPELHSDCLPIASRTIHKFDFFPAAFPLVEVFPGAEEAQSVLEFYLARQKCGVGRVTPVSLAQLIVYAAHDTIIIPHSLVLVLNKVLARARVSAMASHHAGQSWQDLPVARLPFCTYRSYPDQRAAACDLARYLRTVRPISKK